MFTVYYLNLCCTYVVLVPIFKNKSASICSRSNYIPITLVSTVSKVLEKFIYDRISYCWTNQSGLKIKHNTNMCTYAFKEAALKYHSLNSNVYTCFLDAFKAFDYVNHYVLFTKLLKRGIPLFIVRILMFWYTAQTMYVQWKSIISDSFTVGNGLRQVSLHIFSVFIWMT